jgi:hypothetical protein
MEVWRELLEGQIVVFVAVGAPHPVKMLPFHLWRGKRREVVAAGQAEDSPEANHSPYV